MNVMVDFPEMSSALWPQIKAELEKPEYTLRSFSSISKDLGVEEDRIKEVIERHKDEVRFSPTITRNGEAVFTLASRQKNWRERVSEIRHVLVSLS